MAERDKLLGISIFVQWFGAIVFALLCCGFAYYVPKSVTPWLYFHRLIIVVWVLGPPIYFLLIAGWKMSKRKPDMGANEQFFYDSAGKFWAAVLVLLAGIYTKELWLK